MSKSSQSGFTLIELVVVIVILGILAAFAVPRFARLDQQARIASVRAMEGTLRSGSALARSHVARHRYEPCHRTMEGDNVDMTNGYPAPTAAGIGNTLAHWHRRRQHAGPLHRVRRQRERPSSTA